MKRITIVLTMLVFVILAAAQHGLHGSGDNQTGWVQFSEVLHIADQTINKGKATPMIIVMPDDFLFGGNSLVHIAMRKKEIPHEFRVRDGAHNWTYWRESLPVVLSFVSDTFHQY